MRLARRPVAGSGAETHGAKGGGQLLKQHNTKVDIHMFPAGHGFHADYRQSYDPASATQAWKLCTDFFEKHLKA